MKRIEKALVGGIFSLLFFLFVNLTTSYFLILNEDYLFGAFERHNVYNQLPKELAKSVPNDPNLGPEEKEIYAQIIGNISPSLIEKIIEQNISQVLNFIHGKSGDIEIFLPSKELGLGSTDLRWSAAQNAPEALKDQLRLVYGIGNKIILVWVLIFILLPGVFLLYGKVTEPKKTLGGYVLLITSGSLLLLDSLLVGLIVFFVTSTFPALAEPSQVLLKILFSSIFLEVIIVWAIIALFTLTLGLIIRRTLKNTV